MATAEASITGFSSPTTTPSAPMEGMPEALSPAQQEAQHILQHMLQKLQHPQSKYHARYAKWIERNPNLASFCLTTVRPPVWNALEQGLSFENTKAIAGDFTWLGRGVYFDVVKGDKERVYVGQSSNLRLRISQHQKFRYRRDHASLHYHALHASDDNAYGVLCVLPSSNMGGHRLPGMDREALLLNVLEMWMGLVFRCLPAKTLEEWIPSSFSRSSGLGALNIQCPLENYDGARREMVDLSGSEDLLVREWGEMKRAEWKEKVKKELDLVDREEETGVVVEEKTRNIAVTERAPPWMFGVSGAIGGAAMMWLYMSRAKGR
ncbi:uncharacterized protein N0V89_006317 [Didymosphaeria variabile]|uniref:GIY-YIG domain-containing protein n=1 Tax=Didymosphaeria variabile TaxID=1932322 RepID=A0A9W8XMA5_9PLEO|nr:uncharacterized protein N0V89_006317 [Didymosphaeria variabile]KAJ4354580.1 hypothetical protein N0V89_006317 [Didymosphaeria variabile]